MELKNAGVYRIHQFEKQEMIVVCEPEDSWNWYDKMWSYTVEFFRSMNIPVRTLECCSGDLADLKAKSCDVEAWSPRQKKYFEVGSCSNLTDAQARRLGIRIKGENGNYFAHTLNNTVVAPPRMLISIVENNYQPDGSVIIPEVLRPYMGGLEKIEIKKWDRRDRSYLSHKLDRKMSKKGIYKKRQKIWDKQDLSPLFQKGENSYVS